MELQHALPTLEQAGFALFAISYDSVDTLARFADKRGITFPLLSDEGSRTIRELGLLNEHLAEQQAVYGIPARDEQHGVPYPGTFLLNEVGVITEKHFEQSYRVRPTAQLFEEYALGTATDIPPHAVHARAGGLEVQAWTDSPTYRPYQHVRLHVRLTLAAGLHVYATPAPDGYTAVRLELEPREGMSAGESDVPPPRPFRLDGLNEDFLVYEGTLSMTMPVLFTSNLGPTTLALKLAYQACTATTCFPPTSIRVELPLTGLDLIRD